MEIGGHGLGSKGLEHSVERVGALVANAVPILTGCMHRELQVQGLQAYLNLSPKFRPFLFDALRNLRRKLWATDCQQLCSLLST